MSFDTDEASVEGAAPAELFKFVAGTTTYRYTSAERDITVDLGDGNEIFTAVTIKFGERNASDDGGVGEPTLELPINSQLAVDTVFQPAPPQVTFEAWRYHEDTGSVAYIWGGELLGASAQGRTVSFRIPNPLMQKFEQKVPKVRLQVYCNNVLFDRVCKLVRSNHVVESQVSRFEDGGSTLVVTTIGGQANGWADGGEVIHVPTGERRTISTQTGTSLTLLWPFSPAVGSLDDIEIYAGCDHTIDDCLNKFDNTENFLGWPYMKSQSLNDNEGR